MWCFVSLFLVVSTSATDCVDKTRLQNNLFCVEWNGHSLALFTAAAASQKIHARVLTKWSAVLVEHESS